MKLSVSVAVTTLDVLDRHCADNGRPPEEIERTVTTALHDGEKSGELADAAMRWPISG